MEHELKVRRFAVKYNPATLIVEYRKNSVLYVKTIRFKDTTVAPEKIFAKLVKTNPEILGDDKVCHDQLLDLVTLIVSSAGDATGEAGDDLQQIPTLELPSKKSTASNSSSSKPEAVDTYGDLNKASDEYLLKAKAQMNVKFEENALKPGDEDYVWDKKKVFNAPVEACDWDDEDD